MNSPYPDTAEYLAGLLREAELDRKSLRRRISPCEIGHCLGSCCHDGVYLNGDEAALIQDLARTRKAQFESYGLQLPDHPVVASPNFAGRLPGPKTATRNFPMGERVSDYPAHFADTNCVFQGEDGRCGLQRLALDEGLHPWYYKPFTCWMHPLAILQPPSQRPILTLHSPETDPQARPGYPGFTTQAHCGRTDSCGEPAFQVLRQELLLLGQIGHRDFIAEMAE